MVFFLSHQAWHRVRALLIHFWTCKCLIWGALRVSFKNLGNMIYVHWLSYKSSQYCRLVILNHPKNVQNLVFFPTLHFIYLRVCISTRTCLPRTRLYRYFPAVWVFLIQVGQVGNTILWYSGCYWLKQGGNLHLARKKRHCSYLEWLWVLSSSGWESEQTQIRKLVVKKKKHKWRDGSSKGEAELLGVIEMFCILGVVMVTV